MTSNKIEVQYSTVQHLYPRDRVSDGIPIYAPYMDNEAGLNCRNPLSEFWINAWNG